SFTALLPAIQWHLLSGGEAVCAWLIRLACQSVVLILPAYACSYYYTTATQIYVMLRKHEDEIDLSECYLETHVNELFEGISFPHSHGEHKECDENGTTSSQSEQQSAAEGQTAGNDNTISDINADEDKSSSEQ
ncbi:MAG: hypothetical protein JXM68_10780, partial [Sedimentisphaerales bacterium]|nr:hypothetical protein [Sedimentisphaerales bacterium]